MSYDKNTINLSNLEAVSTALNDLTIEHKTIELAKVRGMGLNDHFSDIEDYTLRALVYKDIVEVEQMQRTYDCDSDDFIVSIKFKIDNLPNKFPLETYSDYEGFVDFDSDDSGKIIEGSEKQCEKEENFINLKEIVEREIK